MGLKINNMKDIEIIKTKLAREAIPALSGNCRLENRHGTIKLSSEMLNEVPEQTIQMFYELRLLVTRAEMRFVDMTIEYHCFSPLMEQVPLGASSPRYEIIITSKFGEPNLYWLQKL